MAAARVSRPATKGPSAWSTARPNSCGTITATALATACPAAPPVPSPLKSARLRRTTSRPCWRTSRKRPLPLLPRHTPAAPATRCTSSTANRPRPLRQSAAMPSQLGQWPCQIKLVPVNAPYFNGAKLLIAADCTAYAYANIHQEFMQGRITLIGCPKLDAVEYSEKLTAILAQNDIRSVTVLRMEVPCCGGLEHAAVTALKNSGKFIPWQVVTFSIDGRILDR